MTDIRIGRHPQNDIVLTLAENKQISRHHANIQHDNDGYWLEDCSLNGTRMNGRIVERQRLRQGDQFQIADHDITFIDDADVSPKSNVAQSAGTHPACTDGDDETDPVRRCEAIHHGLPDIKLKERLRNFGIILADEQMLALYRDIQTISQINVPILIMGEPGTGKEKVAQAIHEFSDAKGEFVAVNCSAIPEGLFESELFGSIKGAFSGASTKSGKLEAADQGTLFLDEIGDMGITCQPKLLRFLENRSISRLGETRIRELNIRIVAATNQDLNQMIKSKTFRSDLFHRLACVKFNIPPLRKRKADILPLAEFFLVNYARQYQLKSPEISRQASRLMQVYSWPGNVRELANIMLNIFIRVRGKKITVDDLTSASEEIGNVELGLGADFLSIKDLEKNHILKALKQTGNNKTKASTLLGISRGALYQKIQKYNI